MPGDSDSAGQGDSGYDGGGFGGDSSAAGQGDVGYDSGSMGYGDFGAAAQGDMGYDMGFTGYTGGDSDVAAQGDIGYDQGMTPSDYAGMNEEGFGRKGLYGVLQSPIGKALGMAVGMANPALGFGLGLGKAALGASLGQYGPAMGMAMGQAAAHTGLGPIGGMAAGMMGNAIGGQMSNGQGVGGLGSAAMGNSSTGGSAMDTILPGLLALYQGYTNSKDINGQIGGLQSLYGQDSPYSQTLRQQLERRDAAGGRRSQYGPREVELQAALAGLNSRNAPQLQALYNQRMLNRQRMIQAGMFGLQQAGGINGLRSLFGGGASAPSLDFSGVYNTPSPGEFNLNEFGPGLSNFEVPPTDIPSFFP